MKFKYLQMRRSLTPAAVTFSEAGNRRRLAVPQTTKTSGFQQAAAATTDGSVVFKLISQPETQHRARYQTEGSRGAIKDRAGTGYPMVQLEGCSKTTKIQILIGNDSGKVLPHMFYQVCKVTGKNSNPCDENKIDGTDIIELLAKPHNDMRVICDCVGILKERITDIEARFSNQNSLENSKKKSSKCRMVFRTVVENRNGQPETLQVVSDVINCTQLPGTPEILKMSPDDSPIEGGGELWMIGKNFLKDTRVCFSYSIDGKEEPLWAKVVEPRQDFFHQSHLIAEIPPFFDPNFCGDVEISVCIKSADKVSDPVPFIYKGNPVFFTYAPAARDSSDSEFIKEEVAMSASKAKLARLGSVSVIKPNNAVMLGNGCKKARPTILEPLHSHRSKKTKPEHPTETRRIYSVQGPSLVNENAMFVADINNKNHAVTTFESSAFQFNRISESSDFPENMELLQSQASQEILNPDSPYINIVRDEDQIFSFDDEATGSNITQDSLLDDKSYSPTRTDLTSSSKEPRHEIQSDSQVGSVNDRKEDEKKDIPNISYEATSDDKATISISVPTSILKDQKYFQTVMNTINNALIKKDVHENEENKEVTGYRAYMPNSLQIQKSTQQRPEVSPDQSNQWQNVSQVTNIHHTGERPRERHHSISPSQCNTSIVSKTRKRAFTGEASTSDMEVHHPHQYNDASSDNTSSDNTYSSKAEAEWMARSQSAAKDEIWNSEINDMLEAAMDKIPIVCSKKAELSTSGLLQNNSDRDQEELNAMDWSTDSNAVSIPVGFEEDSSTLPLYFAETVTTLEVREGLQITQIFQNNVENPPEPDILS